jgi:carboxyl-terminal processing protease
MELDSNQRTRILHAIKKRVLAHHINLAAIDYAAWAARVDARTSELLAANVGGFEAGVREFLSELKTSHTGFYSSVPRDFLPQHTIGATLRQLSRNGGSKWMFLDVFESGPAHRAGIGPGDILEAVDGTACLSPSTPQFGFAQTYTFLVAKVGTELATDIAVTVPKRKATAMRPPFVEPKSPIHAKIGPNIGLLKVNYFPGAFGMRFSAVLRRMIEDLVKRDCDRMIVDLRGSIGGSLGFAHLASYMCPGRIAIGHSLTPKRQRAGYDPKELPHEPMPKNPPELLFTLARYTGRDRSLMLLTEGLGAQPFHKRIVVLANEWTNSAAEMVTNFAAENRLATVVGTRTHGSALGAVQFKVGAGYWLRIPIFGWFTSKGGSLEGNGVNPDVEISSDGLAVGRDDQMVKAVEIASAL